MILETFTLDYGNTGLAQAKNDLTAYDKQISELAAKGKKRTEEENKQLKELRKERLQTTLDLKDQTRAADGLGDSFAGIATKIIGVGAALFGLSALKNGVLSSIDKNVGLSNQAFISGQNANDLRTIAAIVESAGGSGEGAVALIDSMRRAANARGIAFTNPLGLLNRANEDIQGKPKQEQARILEQLYGINDEALESQLEQSVEDWRKIVELKERSVALTDEDYEDAKKLKGEISSTGQEFEKFYTKLGTLTLPAIGIALKSLNVYLQGFSRIVDSIKNGSNPFSPPTTPPPVIGEPNSPPTAPNEATGLPSTEKQSSSAVGPAKTSAIAPKTGNDAIDFWLGQGYTLNGAIGMAANEQAESSGNPHPPLRRDKKGQFHYGLYQFDEQRRADAITALNIDVATADADDQRKAAAWDARRRGDDKRVNSGTTPEGSTAIANSFFEVSGEDPRLRRTDIAHQLAMQYAANGQNSSGGSGGLNVKIDSVTINTQATDANGVSKDFAMSLKDHLDDLYSDTNDGIDR